MQRWLFTFASGLQHNDEAPSTSYLLDCMSTIALCLYLALACAGAGLDFVSLSQHYSASFPLSFYLSGAFLSFNTQSPIVTSLVSNTIRVPYNAVIHFVAARFV